jgi:hypothetical protein
MTAPGTKIDNTDVFAKSAKSRAPSLKLYIVGAITLVAISVFIVAFSAASIIYSRTLHQQAVEAAEVISKQTFASMYQVMRLAGTAASWRISWKPWKAPLMTATSPWIFSGATR